MRSNADLNLNTAVQNYVLVHVTLEQFLTSAEFVVSMFHSIQTQCNWRMNTRKKNEEEEGFFVCSIV